MLVMFFPSNPCGLTGANWGKREFRFRV
jgi:hypothetical protein